MMLAIDCTSDRLSVAARDQAGRTAERSVVGARRHARFLAPAALETMRELGGSPDALTGVALADGPGSFTGLRVGAAFAKAIARVRRIPVWTASTLAVRAWGERPREGTRLVAGVGSALRGELYVAVYRLHAATGGVRVDEVVAPTVLARDAVAPAGGAGVEAVIGDVLPDVVSRWHWGPEAPSVVGPPAGFPSAVALLDLVAAGAATRVDALDTWEPEYGRPAEAQARWEREHGRAIDSADPA